LRVSNSKPAGEKREGPSGKFASGNQRYGRFRPLSTCLRRQVKRKSMLAWKLRMGDTGLEHPLEVPEKRGVTEERGTKSGTLARDSSFTAAMAALMRLPLSDAEKAQVVRRLLSAEGENEIRMVPAANNEQRQP
jgi:hypothetical protein